MVKSTLSVCVDSRRVTILIGAIRDWKWVYQATGGDKARHVFIFEVWGEKGYRVFIGLCGVLLMICGVVFLMLDKR